jgi:hypothetical protein
MKGESLANPSRIKPHCSKSNFPIRAAEKAKLVQKKKAQKATIKSKAHNLLATFTSVL